jgi:hypothetical protein
LDIGADYLGYDHTLILSWFEQRNQIKLLSFYRENSQMEKTGINSETFLHFSNFRKTVINVAHNGVVS